MPATSSRFPRSRSIAVTSMSAVAIALVCVAGTWWYLANYSATFVRARVPRLARSAIKVAPGLYLLGGLSPSAAYVVDTSDGLILVDSGLDKDAGLLKAELAKLGLDWKRVRTILLTHAHGDHTGGAQSLRLATGAKVYAGAGDVPILRAGGPREAFFSTFDMPGQEIHATDVDVALKGGETISLADVRIRALATPGHTPGSMCYLMERNNLSVMFAGDVIMMLRGDEPPRGELGKPLGTYSAYLSPRYRGSARDYLESLRRLRELPVPDLLLPGHPGADVTPQSPCLSQERWLSLLEAGIHDLETVLSRYEADGADFLDGIPKQLLPDLYYFGNFRGSAVYGFFASSKFFVVDAPGGPGLLEFLNSRLRRLGREPAAPAAVLLTSCDMAATAGLKELIEKCHTQVVASADGFQSLKDSCPRGTILIPQEELPDKGWFPVVPVSLRGRGFAPAGYQLTLAGKTVLFSGRSPLVVTQQTGQSLIRDLSSSTGNIQDYVASLTELRDRKPNLWLPALPLNDQNANLYDGQWQRVIDDNLTVIQFIVNSGKKP